MKSRSDVRVQLSFTPVDQPPTRQSTNTPASTPPITTTIAVKSKENPYAKPEIDKCYKCGEPGQKSNECPKKKPINMADYRDDEGVVIEDLYKSDFAEEF